VECSADIWNCQKNAKIIIEGGIHSNRHTYATHLHEDGIEIAIIQKLKILQWYMPASAELLDVCEV
jgi:site-specific recombinase XerD